MKNFKLYCYIVVGFLTLSLILSLAQETVYAKLKVPLRSFSELMGAEVKFDSTLKVATDKRDDITIAF